VEYAEKEWNSAVFHCNNSGGGLMSGKVGSLAESWNTICKLLSVHDLVYPTTPSQ